MVLQAFLLYFGEYPSMFDGMTYYLLHLVGDSWLLGHETMARASKDNMQEEKCV